MNKRRLNALAKFLEHLPEKKFDDLGFNMANWVSYGNADRSGHSCGTTACIAGWAAVKAHKLDSGDKLSRYAIATDARKYLDLTPEEADELFLGRGLARYRYLSTITPVEAAQAIRNMVQFGTAKWSEAAPGREVLVD